MFAEWTDPFDIDNYYDDVGKIFTKVSEYVDPTKQTKTVVLPPVTTAVDSAPTKVGIVELPPPIDQQSLQTPLSPTKANFEVSPNTIFLDGHPVGRQPVYNILRSGPPAKETYLEPQYYPHYYQQTDNKYDIIQILNFILFMILFMMIVNLIQVSKSIRKQHRCIMNAIANLQK